MNCSDELEQTLHDLDELNIEALRINWRRHFGAPPPRFRSADLLRRLLAFELQEAAYGGLPAELKQRLRAKSTAIRKPALQPGTVLTRKWRGERHVVQVGDGAYEHRSHLCQLVGGRSGYHWSALVRPTLFRPCKG